MYNLCDVHDFLLNNSTIADKKIGEKYTLLLSMAGYLFHTASNFYPVLPVLLLGAFSVGRWFYFIIFIEIFSSYVA